MTFILKWEIVTKVGKPTLKRHAMTYTMQAAMEMAYALQDLFDKTATRVQLFVRDNGVQKKYLIRDAGHDTYSFATLRESIRKDFTTKGGSNTLT